MTYSDSARKTVQDNYLFVENGPFRSGFEERNKDAAAAGSRPTEEPHWYTAGVYGLAGSKKIPQSDPSKVNNMKMLNKIRGMRDSVDPSPSHPT